MKARQDLNKSTVLMLHYDDLISHVVLQSLCQWFVVSRPWNCHLCELSWLWRKRWKSLLGVSRDFKVQVDNYLKEKRREDLENMLFVLETEVLLVVLRGPETSSAHIWYMQVAHTEESHMLFFWKHSSGLECFQLSDCKHEHSWCECANGQKYHRETPGSGA